MANFDPHRLDVRRFAEGGGTLDGEEALARLRRLAAEAEAEATGDAGARPVRWRARGEVRNPGHLQPQVWVHLEADATLPLVCQRCLEPVEVPLAVRRAFRFVTDEATAAAEDDAADEDLLALSAGFDLLELVEDELLMALPVAPRHAQCPAPVKMSATDPAFEAAAAQKENPFAVLGALRGRKH